MMKKRLYQIFRILLKLSLVMFIFALMLEGLLQAAFNNLPDILKQRMPQAPLRYGIVFDTPHGAREYPAGESVNLNVGPTFGDLYSISCLSPADAPESTSYPVQYTRDEHGFRNPSPWPDQVELVIVGDSFTAAEAIQHPFWEGLSASSLSLGLPGSGSVEQQRLLEAYGLPKKPKVVLMAAFGGNDLIDNWRYYQAQQAGENLYSQSNQNRKPWEYLVTFQIMMLAREIAAGPDIEDCLYPVQDANGTPLAFFNTFLSTATLEKNALAGSDLFRITEAAILKAAQQTEASGAEFVLIYIPHKAQVYWQQLSQETIQQVAATVTAMKPSADGWTEEDLSAVETAQRLNDNIDTQRDLLAAAAQEHGFRFLDLTPHFREAAANGLTSYFFADTHWNQAGHDLARLIIQEYLQSESLLND